MTAHYDALVERVEQAVLGALLAEPQNLDNLGYLETTWFTGPDRAALFAEIRSELTQHADLDSADLIARLASTSTNRFGAEFTSLLEACPDPGAGVFYGRMLAEAHTYRMLEAQAARIEASAGGDAQAHAQAAVLRRPGYHVDPSAEEAPLPGSWKGSRPAREERILADLLQHPEIIDQVTTTVSLDTFSASSRSVLFQTIRAIHSQGEPVDPLTVAWRLDQAQHRATSEVTAVDPLAYVDRLATIPVRPGESSEIGQRIATELRRSELHHQQATDSVWPAERHQQQAVYSVRPAKRQAPTRRPDRDTAYESPAYNPPSHEINREGPTLSW